MTRLLTWEEAVQWLRSQPDQRDLVRAAFYDDPLLDAALRFTDSSEWRAIRGILPSPPGDVLDIGSGRGIAAFAFAREGWRVTALEPDPSALVGAGAIRSLADDGQVEIEVVETWGEDLPFDDNSFDVVHCRQVLHHARDLGDLCRQAARVLRPGGMLIATREHVISRQEDLQKFLSSHPLHDLYGGENAYTLNEYKDALVKARLKILKIHNPLSSDINLCPGTKSDVKILISKKLFWPFPDLIPDFALNIIGATLNSPGRLYSFICRKPENA